MEKLIAMVAIQLTFLMFVFQECLSMTLQRGSPYRTLDNTSEWFSISYQTSYIQKPIDLQWAFRKLSYRLISHFRSLPAGCVRNILRLSPPCRSLPALRAGILGGVWRWCPTWRICTATPRRTTTSSTMERTRSYTLRTSQCQVSSSSGHSYSWPQFLNCD